MNIFTLYALICTLSFHLTNNGFPIQNIDYQNNQIIAMSIPNYEFKAPEISNTYYIKIHYNKQYEHYFCSYYYEMIVFNKKGKPMIRNFEQIYEVDVGFPKIFKPIIKEVEVINEKANN